MSTIDLACHGSGGRYGGYADPNSMSLEDLDRVLLSFSEDTRKEKKLNDLYFRYICRTTLISASLPYWFRLV